MYPTAKLIAKRLRIDLQKAKEIRGVMDGSIDPENYERVQKWVKQCYHKPPKVEMIMCAIDEIYETFGIEHLHGTSIIYCNTGDTYCPTIMYNYYTKNYIITSWGDHVETNNL